MFWYIPSCDIKDGFSAADAAQCGSPPQLWRKIMWLDDVHKMHKEREAFDKSEDGILAPLQHGDPTIREQREIIM